MYAHAIPWNIAGLTIDTWNLEDWKWYIELLNAGGCNFLKIYIWSVYYYHPDEPELASNAWRYDVLHDALAYARDDLHGCDRVENAIYRQRQIMRNSSTLVLSIWSRTENFVLAASEP